jgi:hypothetical protein
MKHFEAKAQERREGQKREEQEKQGQEGQLQEQRLLEGWFARLGLCGRLPAAADFLRPAARKVPQRPTHPKQFLLLPSSPLPFFAPLRLSVKEVECGLA